LPDSSQCVGNSANALLADHPTDTAPAPADTTDASESDRQTLAAIAAIVAEGDKAILQLNACIESYNAIREQVNGHR
jgi:hypothetical protein